MLLEPFSISTPFGDSVMARRIHKKCPVSLSHRGTLIDLVEFGMLDFDLILGMN